MSDFDLLAGPQGHTAVLPGINIPASVGATAQIGAPQIGSINFVNAAAFCRPRS